MKSIPTNEKGHFLNDQQKEIKQKIMEKLMDGFFHTLHDNQLCFEDPQHVLDLMFSILVMFNREILIHFIKTFELQNNRKQIMKNLFEEIKDQVNNNIKRDIQ
jgi:hypothetical protein